jgi:hypothetical protein
MGAVYGGILDKKELESLIDVPLVDSWRALIEKHIETGTVESWAFRLFGSRS